LLSPGEGKLGEVIMDKEVNIQEPLPMQMIHDKLGQLKSWDSWGTGDN